jgi:hypothetical protein
MVGRLVTRKTYLTGVPGTTDDGRRPRSTDRVGGVVWTVSKA